MGNLDSVLESFFYGFCDVAKWIFAIRIASDIIKKGGEKDIEGIIQGVLNGSVGYGALYSVVSILNKVQTAFIK